MVLEIIIGITSFSSGLFLSNIVKKLKKQKHINIIDNTELPHPDSYTWQLKGNALISGQVRIPTIDHEMSKPIIYLLDETFRPGDFLKEKQEYAKAVWSSYLKRATLENEITTVDKLLES